MTQPTYLQYRAFAANKYSALNLQQETPLERLVSILSVPVSGQNPDGTPWALAVTAGGASTPILSTTCTPSRQPVTTTAVFLLLANPTRLGASFFNEGPADCYLLLGGTATTSSYTVRIQPNQFYELVPNPLFTGQVTGITASGTCTMEMSELTP
jgi:hypothetical protein